MIHIIYRITHRDYPDDNYIGSCKDFDKRKINHKSRCYSAKSTKHYNIPLYQL